MVDDSQEATELMRQGRYFNESRQWYNALYVAPIGERAMFMILSICAGLVGLIGFIAFLGLMPITERPELLISNARMNDTQPVLRRLRMQGQTINDSFMRYYVEQYVISRESYLAEEYRRNVLFVSAHSDATAATSYAAAVSADNPGNPVALLGSLGTRTVEVQSVRISGGPENWTATVRFSTEIGGTARPSKTQWTATMQFTYSDAVVSETTDPESGDMTATLQEPIFQVVNYALTQS